MKIYKKIKKIFLIIFILITSFIILLFSASYVVNKYYKKEVISVILKNLNPNFKTKIVLKSYNLSLIKKFPDASIEFIGVFAKSTPNYEHTNTYEDTLLTAKSIFLQFSILDLINKNYKIKAIHINGADIRMFVNKKAQTNYEFWKSTNTKSGNFSLDLNKIKLTNTKFTYINHYKTVNIKLQTKYYSLKGKFSEKKYTITSKGDINLKKININNVEYANLNNIKLKSNLAVNNKKITVKNAILKTDNLSFKINGYADFSDTSILNLTVSGDNIKVKNLMAALPGNIKNKLDNFKSTGLLQFNGIIKGEISNTKSPHIEINFSINNGKITNTSKNITLDSIRLNGVWSNGKHNNTVDSKLELKNLYAKFHSSVIKGSYNIHNFVHPHISVNAKINGNLPELCNFFEIDTIKNITGNIISEFTFDGTFKDFKNISKNEILKSKTKGFANINNVNLQLKGSSTQINNLNSKMRFTNKNIIIDSLSFTQNNNDFNIKGFLYNILPFIFTDEKELKLSGSFYSNNFDAESFIKTLKTNKKERNNNSFNLNDYITYSLTYNIKHFKYKTFTGNNFKGNLKFFNKKLTLTDVNINTLDGVFKGKFQLQKIDSTLYRAVLHPDIKDININKMFKIFDNFGQNFIKAENINGKISSRSRINFLIKNSKIDRKSIDVVADVKIVKGQLINFAPLKKLSRFIELSELENVSFSTIQNQIKISEETIYIPQMDINSSAFNIGVKGQQTFDGKINYNIQLLLSDFLSNKARKAKRENTEFGHIEDDGLGKTKLYLKIFGTTKDFKIKYDTKGVKEHIKDEAKKEKTTLKSILNDEFGWFKKDSTLKKQKEKKKQEEKKKKKKKIRIQWEDE